ncbi:hypothetical protein [Streptomyces xanthochromogenes]|uniref:hypothetical protein n=2 Tax=Streptomyces xanthochromogenes TaxID=67384 RepID=UPI002F3EDE1B
MKIVRTAIAAALTGVAFTAFAIPASAAEASDSPRSSFSVKMVEHSESRDIVNGKAGAAKAASTAHYFTPQNPSYVGDSVESRFTGQVKYGSDKLTFAWSNQLNSATSSPATGLMNEVATTTYGGKSTGYKDTHIGVPASYLVHSSFTVSTGHYVLSVNHSFPIKGGTRNVLSTFDFVVTLV